MPDIEQLKKDICLVGRRMYERGLVAARDGNISYRLGDGRFLSTPAGVSKGFMTPDMISIVDSEGTQLEGDVPRSSEILLHLEVYRRRSDVTAVCHAHPPHATAFAVANQEPPTGVMPEVEVHLGRVPVACYELPGTEDLAATIRPLLDVSPRAILLANHGAVTYDTTLEQSYLNMELLESYCQIIMLSQSLGGYKPLDEKRIRQLHEVRRQRS